jgi:septum site-determining protein MinC
MAADRISIKGTSDGLTITIGSGDWQYILSELQQLLSQKAAFFKGGRVTLQVGDRLLDQDQIEAVGRVLVGQQMSLWSIQGNAEETLGAAQALGLEALTGNMPVVPATMPAPVDDLAEATMTVRRTLRSGQHVEYPGNVVIIGDVNPGAKVTAGGYIIIWGRLRGTAHAGAINLEGAFVCALELAPMQLIIGSIIARSPADEARDEIVPEMAFVQDGQIIAEAWR